MTTRLVGLEIEGTAVDLIIEDGRARYVSERKINCGVVHQAVADLEDKLLGEAATLNGWRYMAGAAPVPVAPANPRRSRVSAWLTWAALAGAALLLCMAEVIGWWEMARWARHG